jgi:hypothetical protein
VTDPTLREPPLPQCSREERLGLDWASTLSHVRRVDRVTRSSATAVCGASFIRSGAPHLERRKGRERKEESVQTDPGGRVFALAVRLPGRSQRTKRFESAGELRSVRLAEAGSLGAANRDGGGGQARDPGRTSRGVGTGTGTGQAHDDGCAGRSHRQERGRAQNLARPTNERGGTRTRKDLALQRRAVHRRHPALPGCADEAVRNSCVRGKER